MRHEDFGDLHEDLRRSGFRVNRRDWMRISLSAGALYLLGCGDDKSTSGGNNDDSCEAIPEETAGPYPGDGSNGPNVLSQSGIVRSDIRSSFGGLTGDADGIPLTVRLSLVSTATCAPLAGRAIYLWHCDREGRYSLYSSGATDKNYLRGVQETDSDGNVTFTTIFPAAYSGRWPHIHFEVYPSLAAATDSSQKTDTSQLALPEDVCNDVYATAGYEASAGNLAQTSLTTDMVFRDGSSQQLAAVTGSTAAGYQAALQVAV